MIEKFERQMQVGGWVLVAVFALLAVWLWQNIDLMHRSGNVSDTFTVEGTGKVTASPDIAVVDVTISVEGATSTAAQDQANVKSNAVVDYLKNTGIATKDITTSGYNIYPQYDYTDGKTRIRGYQVTQSLTVKIRDIDKTNTIVDGVVDAGANQVGSVRFEIDEPDKLVADARAKAIAEAKQKADLLASQLGVHLGNIVSYSESGQPTPTIMYGRDMKVMSAVAEAVPAPQLPAGETEVTVTVSVTYQIR